MGQAIVFLFLESGHNEIKPNKKLIRLWLIISKWEKFYVLSVSKAKYNRNCNGRLVFTSGFHALKLPKY